MTENYFSYFSTKTYVEMLSSNGFMRQSECKFTPKAKRLAAELSPLLVLTYTYFSQSYCMSYKCGLLRGWATEPYSRDLIFPTRHTVDSPKFIVLETGGFSVEQKKLCNLVKRPLYGEDFIGIILNSDRWFWRCCLKVFLFLF